MGKEISIPSGIQADSAAQEIMRVWKTGDQQTAIFEGTVWSDPAVWGIICVDILRHVADAYEHEGSYSAESAFERIKSGLQAELDTQTY